MKDFCVDFAMNIDGDNFSLHLMALELCWTKSAGESILDKW
jgi:hypothetical protein